MNLKQYDLIEIEWRDAEDCIDGGWKTIEEANSWFGLRTSFFDAGYFVLRNKYYIFLCSGYSKKGNGNILQISGIKSIPLGCVKKITKLPIHSRKYR